MPREPHPKLPPTRKPMPPVGTPEHEEWLIDGASGEVPRRAIRPPRRSRMARLR